MTNPARRRVAIIVALALSVLPGRTAHAYLKLGITFDGVPFELKWTDMPVQYFVTEAGVPGVDAAAFRSAVTRGFDTWQAVSTASITYEFAGFTTALPGEDDGWSTIGFRDEPDLDRVLASTNFLIDVVTGSVLESDIFFNSSFQWSTATPGQNSRFDVETIAVHEIGHFSGLGHSALGETTVAESGRRVLAAEAVMFPIAFAAGTTANRSLHADDIAGISDLYPDGSFESRTGSVSGRVTKNGAGLFGAHIVAFNPTTRDLVGNFALTEEGEFSIAGLAPGAYVIRVEPLDDADIESFFDLEELPDVDFRVAFHNRLVVVPRGGDSGTIEIKVVPK